MSDEPASPNLAMPPDESAGEVESKARGRRPWRDHLEALATTVTLVALLKYFAIEAYRIPSGSMQPTLMGDERTGVFDRILVDKLSTRFRDPERFEITVFRYPLDRSKNFVKRIIGLPGEHVRIRYGDVWVRATADEPWRIPRRSERVQQSTWKRLDRLDGTRQRWSSQGSDRPWTFGARSIRAEGSGMAAFQADAYFTDNYSDGYPDSLAGEIVSQQGSGGENMVGDLRLEASVAPGRECEAIIVELSEGRARYQFTLPGPAAKGDAHAVITSRGLGAKDDTARGAAPWRLPANTTTGIAVQNLDDRLEIHVAGQVLCTLDVPPTFDAAATLKLGVAGPDTTDFSDLMVYRDIFYTESGQTVETIVPNDSYFVLGDNTQDSSDSRRWTLAVFDVRRPDGSIEQLTGDFRRGNDNPHIQYGGLEGPVYWLRDQFGERHRFLHSDIVGTKRYEPAPFVARNLIQGRALAVFWPLNLRRRLFRFGWVH